MTLDPLAAQLMVDRMAAMERRIEQLEDAVAEHGILLHEALEPVPAPATKN